MVRQVILELAGQTALARDLAAGGVLVPDVLTINEDVELLLRGSGQQLQLAARCVWVNGDKGSGLQLHGCDAEMKQRIAALAETPSIATSLAENAPVGESTEPVAAAPEDDDDDELADAKKVPTSVHERLRGLSLAQQVKLAHHGEVSERVILERMYGKTVWEALLRNPRITGPEVARIARMGSLPRPLMEIIVGNGGWLQIPEIRRALLSNPRLGADQIMKILRMLPKHELRLAATQTAYPHAVRETAKRILKEAAGG